MRQVEIRRSGRRWLAMAAGVLLMAGASATSADAGELELVEEGVLTVAFNGDMPGTGYQDGALIGIDGELMMWVADKLGLKVKPALMEWAAEIASVKARRVDIMHGMMGWTQQRTEVISISDPIYYGGANLTQKTGTNYSTIQDMRDHSIATIQGFGWIPDLKKLNPDLRLYDTSDQAVRDLLAGRYEILLADPPLIKWVIEKNPDWDIHAVPLDAKHDPELPIITAKWNMVFGMSQEAPNLVKAVNAAIAEMWESCKNFEVAKKYGFADPFWFEPPAIRQRQGVDRPEDWEPQVLPEHCKG